MGRALALGVQTAGVALECFVGKARLALPADVVDQIVEYDVSSPLPMARRFVGGIGLVDERAVVCVSLDSGSVQRPRGIRRTKAVLLRRARPEALPWAVEIAGVGGFVRVAMDATDSENAIDRMPPWVRLGRTPDGRTIGWIDAVSMMRELGEDGPRGA